MTDKKKADDTHITDVLAKAGWTPIREKREYYPERYLGMRFRNDSFDTSVTRWDTMEEGRFFLETTEGRLSMDMTYDEAKSMENSSRPTGQLYVEYGDQLDKVLEAVIDLAKGVNYDTVAGKIKAVLDAAPRAYDVDFTAGAQGDPGESYTHTINPDTWLPK